MLFVEGGPFVCAEDREDLRMFEEGVSSPTPMHTAWSAAASSLQMRHALPEVSLLTVPPPLIYPPDPPPIKLLCC